MNGPAAQLLADIAEAAVDATLHADGPMEESMDAAAWELREVVLDDLAAAAMAIHILKQRAAHAPHEADAQAHHRAAALIRRALTTQGDRST